MLAIVERPTQQSPRKIDLAVLASIFLCRELLSSEDRCCVASFSNSFTIHTNFTTSREQLAESLKHVITHVGGGTRLYDAIRLATFHFRQNGRRDAVWLLLVVTDGNDDDSSQEAAVRYCHEVGSVFQDRTNFGFLLGVGQDVNVPRLGLCAAASKLDSLPVESFALLAEIFKRLLLQVQRQVQGVLIVGDGSAAVLQREQISVSRIPIDVMLVMDVSGSMNERL